jgi:small subunit ribosomal protein S6
MVTENAPGIAEGLCEYELITIINPEIAEEGLEASIESVSQYVTGRDGVVSEVERWGKRPLSYPIKRFAEGHYVLTRFQMKPEYNRELETNLKISDNVIRHLLIKLA